MSGWVEHGFYQFSPVFFRFFKDKWETVFLKILILKINSLVDDWHILSYDYKICINMQWVASIINYIKTIFYLKNKSK